MRSIVKAANAFLSFAKALARSIMTGTMANSKKCSAVTQRPKPGIKQDLCNIL